MKKEALPRPIFVIGTGRSGTHWLGYTLAVHPEIRATVETDPMFSWSIEMALNPDSKKFILSKLIEAYRQQLEQSAPKHYLDKNHPNIWLAEELIGSFPNALFLGIQRNPYATVASMMAHKGVSAWHKRWKEFPVLNRFLGLTENAVEGYDDLSLAAQCAMRWLSHQQRMQQLRGVLGRALMVIEYEDLARVPQEIVLTLARFLELREPIDTPYVKTESLYKWRAQLTPADIRDIFTVTGSPPDNDVGTGVSMSNLLVSTSASQKH